MRKIKMTWAVLCVLGLALGLAGAAQAAVVYETVHVGNPGNANDYTGYGAVAYEYDFGKYEVTASQYAAFLNAVAATDTYGLYHTTMGATTTTGRIVRSGESGSYTYAAGVGYENRPVGYNCWYDQIRLANWLTNGQPIGAQGVGTTETGSYTITDGIVNGGTVTVSDAAQRATWAAGTTVYWMVSTENEWYKAAFHKNDGVTANYWTYATGSDTIPTAEAPPGTDMVNGSANYNQANGVYNTNAGAYTAKPSDSPYGTFDQNGNMWEPFEADATALGIRGACWTGYHPDHLPSSYRQYNTIAKNSEFKEGGIRLISVGVPEPATLALLGLGGLGMLLSRKRK